MTFAAAVDFLLENGYLAVINSKVTITGKFTREFNPVPTEKKEEPKEEKKVLMNREDVWKKFITDAAVPYKVVANDGKSYIIRQYSPAICDALIRIITKPGIEYNILTESTKAYYASNSYKVVLSNYLNRRIWEEEYNSYLEQKSKGKVITPNTSGGNKFED